MTTHKEALKLALEALKHVWNTTPDDDPIVDNAITAIKEALAHPEQEPVGEPAYYAHRIERSLDDVADEYVSLHRSFLEETAQTIRGLTKEPEQRSVSEHLEPVAWMRKDETCTDCFVWERTDEHTIPLYTTPPQRTWVGLTDDDCLEALKAVDPKTKRLPLGFSMFAANIQAKLKEKNT